jgi:hypothetical protein
MTMDTQVAPQNNVSEGTLEAWVVEAYAAIETQLEQTDPRQRTEPNVLQRHIRLMEVIGAIQLGLIVAAVCMSAVFLVLNFIFHMQP